MGFLNTEIFNNSIMDWIIALAIAMGTYFCIKGVVRLLIRKFRKKTEATKNRFDGFALKILEQTKGILIFTIGLYFGIQYLVLPFSWNDAINKSAIVLFALQVGYWLGGLINFLVEQKSDQASENKSEKTAIHAFGLFGKILIWVIVVMVILENVSNMNLDALITSLGIGGIAIGLAVQNILKDIFASLSIYLDKPFLVGDYIIVDDIGGTVQNIGIKSTRIKTLLGEEVIFANSDLLESRVHNFRKLERRRESMEIRISVETSYENLRMLPELFAHSIKNQELASFERAHLARLEEYAYVFEIVYFIESADYTQYMDTKQAVYLEILKQLQEKQIEMPYPTKTIVINK
ncbi:MAG TPA: hypothetical protein DCK95_12075 [Anaerolineaceae bacterium]|nr:hypothetical protein [Anaerolineaceae bacterium]